MFTQLNPPLPVFIPSKGEKALAHGVIDYGIENNLLWVCFLDTNGECWTVPNTDIKMQFNVTAGRTGDKKCNTQT
jgi:hypothetical protein